MLWSDAAGFEQTVWNPPPDKEQLVAGLPSASPPGCEVTVWKAEGKQNCRWEGEERWVFSPDRRRCMREAAGGLDNDLLSGEVGKILCTNTTASLQTLNLWSRPGEISDSEDLVRLNLNIQTRVNYCGWRCFNNVPMRERCWMKQWTVRGVTWTPPERSAPAETQGRSCFFPSGWQPSFMTMWLGDCVRFRQNGSILPTQRALPKIASCSSTHVRVTQFKQRPSLIKCSETCDILLLTVRVSLNCWTQLRESHPILYFSVKRCFVTWCVLY